MAVSCLQVSGVHNGAMPWCLCLKGMGCVSLPVGDVFPALGEEYFLP